MNLTKALKFKVRFSQQFPCFEITLIIEHLQNTNQVYCKGADHLSKVVTNNRFLKIFDSQTFTFTLELNQILSSLLL